MTALDLAPIRARDAAATPGPWAWRGNMDNEDPRLVGWNHIGEDGRRRFPGIVEVLWSYPRERKATDAAARSYREFLTDGGCPESEVDQRVRDEWLTDSWCEPIRERRLCFTSPECFALDARELAVFEVARARGIPDDTPRDDPRIYRADIVDVRHPDAQFIAHAREDVSALLAEVERLRGVVRECAGVVAYVSRGRGFVDVERYPDATARRVNALIWESIGEPVDAETVPA